MLSSSCWWLSIPLWWVGLCALQNFGVEAKINIEFENVVIAQIDPKYFDPVKTDAFINEDKDTGVATFSSSVAIIKELPVEARIHVGLRGMSMGKYTIPTGLDLNMSMCDILGEPIVTGPFLTAMGFSEDSCPPKLGVYTLKEHELTMDDYPDEFAENKYEAFFKMTINNKNIIVVNTYVNVEVD